MGREVPQSLRFGRKKWQTAWATYANRALETADRQERIDHRSYKRQGIEEIPSIHMGPAASQMERRGVVTEKGNINRQIAADNKLLKEIKVRITRLYNWAKEQTAQPQDRHIPDQPYEAQAKVQTHTPSVRQSGTGQTGKYQQENRAELALFDTASLFLKNLKMSGEAITPKARKAEAAELTAQKDIGYQKMRAMRDDIKAVESLKKAADRIARESQHLETQHNR